MTDLPPLPLPSVVNLESSMGCNLSCRMCGPSLSGATRQRTTMSAALLARVEREVLLEVDDLSLTVSGEPLLHPDLGLFIDMAERAGARLQMHTNGTLFRPSAVHDTALLTRLLAGASLIVFSVDAADPDLYAWIRQGASLDRVLANIRDAVRMRAALPRARRPRLVLSMVLMRCNLEQLVAMVDLTRELGLDALQVAHLTVMTPELDAQSLRHAPALADVWLRAARRRADELGLRLVLPPLMGGGSSGPGQVARLRLAGQELRGLSTTRLRRGARAVRRRLRELAWARRAGGRLPCHLLRRAVYISVGGDVSPCCMPGRPVAGNLLQQPFESIWNGPVLSSMRRGLMQGRPWEVCAHCSQNPVNYVPSDERTVKPEVAGGARGER